MTKDETILLMAMMKEAYPSFYKDKSEGEVLAAVNLWFKMLGDNSAKLVQIAVEMHIANNKFPPTIADINENINKLTVEEELTELEAWNLVKKAIENSAYHAKEEFEKLPDEIKRLVGSPNILREWCVMPIDQVNSIIASNFQRSFRARSKSEEDYRRLPQATRTVIGKIANKLSLDRMLEGKSDE